MATSSRQSALFGVQDWKKIYQTYREADFKSYDYETLRKSFIDYLTQYYPETYNDYIESSEFVALLDVIAFMGQALAFRGDLNARENFIDTAERRDSVIKLANLVSYTPKRSIAAQGLVKVTAISTTENLTDINGVNLNNATVLWNDPANPSWQEQFNTILNASLLNSQRVGRPGNSQTILNVKTDEYTINIPNGQLPVVPYRSDVDGASVNFELVSATSLDKNYLYELPPAPTSQFNILYRNDKLGYGSTNTGFFFYFKQGTLQNYDFNFAEKIENNFQQIGVENINDSDTWLYQLDATGSILSRWEQVDNIFVNPDTQGSGTRKVFTVASRFNDQVTYVFGDGVFGEIPVGQFRSYLRTSNSRSYTISPSEMNGVTVNINYISRLNRIETLTLTFSLQTTVNNAQQREALAQIKERAPSRYYTQNRMVNGEDYTNLPFAQYNSIIKSKAVNRSSIGISRNQDLMDPTGKYSSTNVFADDGALYENTQDSHTTFSTLSINIAVEFLSQSLPVFLAETAVIQYYQAHGARFSGVYPSSSDNKCYWKRLTVADGSVSGYFYIKSGSGSLPIPVGDYSNYNMKYISKGAQLKFVAPAGQYFDKHNRLQTGIPNNYNGDKLSIWTGVSQVTGDGFNFGRGVLNNGFGPVVLSDFIPSGAILDTNQATPTAIIPSFDNTLSNTLIRQLLNSIELKNSFKLYYNNQLTATQERWSTTAAGTESLEMLAFDYNSVDLTYLVTFKNLSYYFGSVSENKFLFDSTARIFDARSGKSLSDHVNIFKTNATPDNLRTLGSDYILNITGQQIQSDGYPDDFAVKVSSINPRTGVSYDPDFFTTVVGVSANAYVFFRIYNGIDDLYRYELLAPDAINYAYPTQSAVSSVLYEYPANTVFYTPVDDKFFKSMAVSGSNAATLVLQDVSTSYSNVRGRGGINFQYRHNSNNTTRIDPATTNIIDLYLVTQSYYTNYQNWLKDTTDTVAKPSEPTINELQQEYGNLDNYKMISDSVILNSVRFKPLFGTKAEGALQGTIKVIKSPVVTTSDSQIRSSVLAALNSYFTLNKWDFGDTFYFSELTAYLHVQLGGLISSVVLVPNDPNQTFGDLYEIQSSPNEIFVNGATTNDIIVISALTPQSLQR